MAGLLDGEIGVSVATIAGVVVGTWLMIAPAILDYAGMVLADLHRVAGPVAASLALVSAWEATRALRWPNVLMSAFVAASVVFFDVDRTVLVVTAAAGASLAIATPFARRRRHQFAGGWWALVGSTTQER